MAFFTPDPPVFAAIAPSTIKNTIAKPYRKYSIFFKGRKSVTNTGNNPPTVKESMKSEENKEVVSKTKQSEEVKQEANGTAIKETTLKKVESELVQKVEEIKESAQ